MIGSFACRFKTRCEFAAYLWSCMHHQPEMWSEAESFHTPSFFMCQQPAVGRHLLSKRAFLRPLSCLSIEEGSQPDGILCRKSVFLLLLV